MTLLALPLLNTPMYAACCLMLLLAVSEIVSIATRAWIPSMLVAMIGYIALLWTHLAPTQLATISTLGPIGSVLVGVVIAHMGTMIPLNQIQQQWRALAIAIGSMAIAVILVLAVVTPLFGFHVAAASAGPVTGGIVAFLISSEKLKALGLASLLATPALVLAIHSLIGMPAANVMLRRYAVKLRDAGIASERPAATAAPHPPSDDDPEAMLDDPATRHLIIPPKYLTAPVLLGIMFLLASFATALDKLTGLNYGIWALGFGIGAHALGIVPAKALQRANSFGIAMNIIVIVVLGSLNTLTPAGLRAAIVQALVIIACALVGLFLGGFVLSKLVRWSPLKGIPVALTALIGFPADYLICQEVSKSVGRTPEEREAIMGDIYTPMLIGGFATVTTSSVLVASILMSLL